MIFPEACGSVCISLIYGDMCSVREAFGSKRDSETDRWRRNVVGDISAMRVSERGASGLGGIGEQA